MSQPKVIEARSENSWSPLKVVPIFSLIVTIVGLFLTVQARKKEITCEYIGGATLVSVDAENVPSDFRIQYKGIPVRSVDKLTFRLRNTGGSGLKHDDIRDAIRLVFPAEVRVVGANVTSVYPAGIRLTATLQPGSNNEVQIDFDLFNSGDEATFAVYAVNSKLSAPKFVGRIFDVPRLILIYAPDEQNAMPMTFIRSAALRAPLRWILVLIQWILVLLFVAAIFRGTRSYLQFLPWKKKWGTLYAATITVARSKPVTSPKGLLSLLGDDFTYREELKEAGIPSKPKIASPVESFTVLLAIWIICTGMCAIFGYSGFVIFRSLQ